MPTNVVPRTTPHRSRRAVSRSSTFVPFARHDRRRGVEVRGREVQRLGPLAGRSDQVQRQVCAVELPLNDSMEALGLYTKGVESQALFKRPGQFVLESTSHSARCAFPKPGTWDVSSHDRESAGGLRSKRARCRRGGPVTASRQYRDGYCQEHNRPERSWDSAHIQCTISSTKGRRGRADVGAPPAPLSHRSESSYGMFRVRPTGHVSACDSHLARVGHWWDPK